VTDYAKGGYIEGHPVEVRISPDEPVITLEQAKRYGQTFLEELAQRSREAKWQKHNDGPMPDDYMT
jgi:hypothetical protein